MDTAEHSTRHFHLTPGHCLLALLAVEFLLFLSQWFRWLPKGWPVLIAIAAVGVLMILMLGWFGVALVFRRRFQFSVRSLLVLTIAVALPCSWLVVERAGAKRQKEAKDELGRLGVYVQYDYQVRKSGNPLPGARPPGPAWLRSLLGEDFLATVVYVSCPHRSPMPAWSE